MCAEARGLMLWQLPRNTQGMLCYVAVVDSVMQGACCVHPHHSIGLLLTACLHVPLCIHPAVQPSTSASGVAEFTAQVDGQAVFMTPADLAIKLHPAWKAIAEQYASDDATFAADFAAAWTKVVNADRFKGPAGSVCGEEGASLSMQELMPGSQVVQAGASVAMS